MSPRLVPSSVSAPSTVCHFYCDPVPPRELMGRKNSCSGKSKVVSHLWMADRGNVLSLAYWEQPTRCCVPCGAQWRFGGSYHQQYQVFFAESVGSKRTTKGMAATKEVITADSFICDTCHMSFHNTVGNGWRPTSKALLSSPPAIIPPKGPARALSTVTLRVYEALIREEVVNSEDTERSLIDVRAKNGLGSSRSERTGGS